MADSLPANPELYVQRNDSTEFDPDLKNRVSDNHIHTLLAVFLEKVFFLCNKQVDEGGRCPVSCSVGTGVARACQRLHETWLKCLKVEGLRTIQDNFER